MSYNVSKAEIESAGDNTLGGVVVALVFVILTITIYGILGSQTNVLGQSSFIQFLTQVVLGGILILLISIFANYSVLKWVRQNAKQVIFWGFMGTILFFVGGIFLLGIFLFLSNPFIGGVVLFVAIALGALAIFFWKAVQRRIDRAARWLSVASSVVMSEPGMLLMSLAQSVVLTVGAITQYIVIYSFQYFQADNLSADQMNNILSIISFFYIWFTFFTLYYFGGVNVHMAYARIKGVDPTIGQGISSATRKIPSLLLYSLISTIVQVVTNFGRYSSQTRSQNGFGVRNTRDISAAVLGAVWQIIGGIIRYLYYLVSFFTLPIIIIRRKGAIAAMKESYHYFKNNPWDIIISDMSFSWGVWSIYLFTSVISGVAGFAYGTALTFIYWGGTGYIVIGILFAFITFMAGIFITKLFISPLYTAFTTTIYVYASEGPDAIAVAPPELITQIENSMSNPATNAAMANKFM